MGIFFVMRTFSNNHFFSSSDFFKQKFGFKVYKLCIDAGCTCPNRDGTKGIGGCIFCSGSGSGDFAQSREFSVLEQLEKAKKLVNSKCKSNKYIAYFQNFSNTYGDINLLKEKWKEALSAPDVVGLSIATRPDCLDDKVLEVFSELSQNNFLMLELGLQTCNEETGNLINRCYSNQDFVQAVRAVKKNCPQVHVVSHVIFGLPGEKVEDMLDTIKFCVKQNIDGIKISTLYVNKGTVLEKMYEQKEFGCLSKEEYFEILSEAIKLIPENIVIHRVTGDGAKRDLVAPLWTANKKDVLNSMNNYFNRFDVRQGSSCSL